MPESQKNVNDEFHRRLADVPTWIQSAALLVPVVMYAFVYSIKYISFSYFRLPPDLIAIRIEDVFLIVALSLGGVWGTVFVWIADIINSKKRLLTFLSAIESVFIIALSVDTVWIVSAAIRFGKLDYFHIVFAVLQVVFLLIFHLSILGRFGKRTLNRKSQISSLLISGFAFVYMCIQLLGFIWIHAQQYTIIEDDAIIIAYCGDNTALVKEIVAVDNDLNTCCVSDGFRIVQLESKNLLQKQFAYIEKE